MPEKGDSELVEAADMIAAQVISAVSSVTALELGCSVATNALKLIEC